MLGSSPEEATLQWPRELRRALQEPLGHIQARLRPIHGRVATHTFVNVQLELLLGDALLDPLAEGGIAGRADTAVPVINQAAALAVKGGSGGPIPAVLLGAETIHRPAPPGE